MNTDLSTQPGGRFGRTRYQLVRTLFVAVTVMAAGGCGYSNESLHRENVRTVYVEMFQSREFRRGIEFQLTEALRKEIEKSTPYRNAPRNRADSVLEGEVIQWQEAAVGKDFITNRPREAVGTLYIRYRWKDMRTGKLLVDRPTMITTVQYVRPAGEESYDAYQLAADQMSRRIVESMETPW